MRVLGQGGFGITYLAFDLNLNGAVALKEYFPAGYARRLGNGSVGPASPKSRDTFHWGLKRFLAEARTIHGLRHPNVVRALRYFEDRGSAFIVMEYIEGDSLEEILRHRSKLTFAEWRPLLEKLLAGLEHVHQRDLLHRDLKPANIVVRDVDGVPVLIDFGSARIAAGERTKTPMVTDGYAPIEQYGGEKQNAPTDLYALGAVSYRALLGERPPTAPNRVIGDTIARLSERLSGAEPGWVAALDRCLALQPKDRPPSVAALREAVRRPSVSASDRAVETYRQRFERPKSGRGMALVAPLSPPFADWGVRRWVGRRTSGQLSATVFEPFHRFRGTKAGDKPLFQKDLESPAQGFAWLLELEDSGAIEEVAGGRIESVVRPRTGRKRPPSRSLPSRSPPSRPPPTPREPPARPPVEGESGRTESAVGPRKGRESPSSRSPPSGLPPGPRGPQAGPRTGGESGRSSSGSSVRTLSEFQEKQAAKKEEAVKTTGKVILWLWYGSPLAVGVCASGGEDGIVLIGIAGVVTAVIACAAAFGVSERNGVRMLTTFVVLFGLGILAFQQESGWPLVMFYLFGGAAVWWVGQRQWRERKSA